jgi:hypothetical protein
VAHYHHLQTVHLPDSDESETSELTQEELVEAIVESTSMNTVDQWGASALRMLLNNPDFVVLRTGTGTVLVLFADGRHYVFLSADVDAAFRRLGSPLENASLLPMLQYRTRQIIWVPSDSDSDDDPPVFHESSCYPAKPSHRPNREPCNSPEPVSEPCISPEPVS